MKILEAYLPAAMSEADLEKLVKAVIAELGATDKKAMGAVMKACQTKPLAELTTGLSVPSSANSFPSSAGWEAAFSHHLRRLQDPVGLSGEYLSHTLGTPALVPEQSPDAGLKDRSSPMDQTPHQTTSVTLPAPVGR